MNTRLRIPVLGTLMGLAIVFGLTSTGSAVVSGDVAPEKESVRKELSRLQQQTGLSLVTLESLKTLVVDFRRRGLVEIGDAYGAGTISHDGTKVAFGYFSGTLPTYLGISSLDLIDFQPFPNFQTPNDMCWSNDGNMLAMFLNSFKTAQFFGLEVWLLKSNTTLRIADNGSLTSQCWSPDDKQIVYEVNGNLNVYDAQKKVSRELRTGKFPTWSPDGEWIAFLDHDTYYAIHPDGQGKKLLFRKKYAQSALWWSPDSRMVAYVAVANPFVGGLTLDIENYRLHVRRLSDNSDDWVANSGGGSRYQWFTDPKLLHEAQSKSAHE